MSIDAKANLDPGTEMKFLAPPLAERFNLDLVESDNYHDMIDGLKKRWLCNRKCWWRL